ncbi:MAG: hypothetical protein JOY72_02495 [Actinobacteria bacterium]|nr:hypothetical protein [Actinomycetota bacterium]
MRGGKFTFAAAVTAAAIAAAPAAAQSPPQTARSFANGHTSQSASTLRKTLANPTVQGYQSPTTGVAMQQHATKTAQGVLPASASSHGTLPFTGLDLGLFAGIGIALIGGGLLMRKLGRDRN